MAQKDIHPTSEQLYNCTIRLEGYSNFQKESDNEIKSIGTGFFFDFEFEEDNLRIPVIVTNFHVVKDINVLLLRFKHSKDGSPAYGRNVEILIENLQNLVIKHPSVDLAIIPLKLMPKASFTPHIQSFTERIIPGKRLMNEIKGIEEIFMIGYPFGLWDEFNNIPIIRKGTTATPYFLNYENEKVFLIDIPVFPGSSGSPVVLFNEGSYTTRNKPGQLIAGTRIALLGINAQEISGNESSEIYKGKQKLDIKTLNKVRINIAKIIKAEELLTFRSILLKFKDEYGFPLN